MGMHTPWGSAQTQKQIARGIIQVSTAGHGGIHVSPTLNAKVHDAWRQLNGWYEEDCEWAIVALTFPQHFPEEHVTYAHESAKRWHAKAYAVANGVATPETVAVGDCPTCGKHYEWYGGWKSLRCGEEGCDARVPLRDEQRIHHPDGTVTTATPTPERCDHQTGEPGCALRTCWGVPADVAFDYGRRDIAEEPSRVEPGADGVGRAIVAAVRSVLPQHTVTAAHYVDSGWYRSPAVRPACAFDFRVDEHDVRLMTYESRSPLQPDTMSYAAVFVGAEMVAGAVPMAATTEGLAGVVAAQVAERVRVLGWQARIDRLLPFCDNGSNYRRAVVEGVKYARMKLDTGGSPEVDIVSAEVSADWRPKRDIARAVNGELLPAVTPPASDDGRDPLVAQVRTLYQDTLRDEFGVTVGDDDPDEAVMKALQAAYAATPSDSRIDAAGLGAARRTAGQNAANLVPAMARASGDTPAEPVEPQPEPVSAAAQAFAAKVDRTNGELDAAILAHQADPTPANHERVMAAARQHRDGFFAEERAELMAKQYGQSAGPDAEPAATPTAEPAAPDAARTILTRATWSTAVIRINRKPVGVHVLHLPAGRLERDEYDAVRDVVAPLGGAWRKDVRGFVFEPPQLVWDGGNGTYTRSGKEKLDEWLGQNPPAVPVEPAPVVDGVIERDDTVRVAGEWGQWTVESIHDRAGTADVARSSGHARRGGMKVTVATVDLSRLSLVRKGNAVDDGLRAMGIDPRTGADIAPPAAPVDGQASAGGPAGVAGEPASAGGCVPADAPRQARTGYPWGELILAR